MEDPSRISVKVDKPHLLPLIGEAIMRAEDDVVRLGKDGEHEVPPGQHHEHVIETLHDLAMNAMRTGFAGQTMSWRGVGIGFEYGTPPEPETSMTLSILRDVEGLNVALVGGDRELRAALLTPDQVGEDFDMHVYATVRSLMQQAEQAASGTAAQQPEPDRAAETREDHARRKHEFLDRLNDALGVEQANRPDVPSVPLTPEERGEFGVISSAAKAAALGFPLKPKQRLQRRLGPSSPPPAAPPGTDRDKGAAPER